MCRIIPDYGKLGPARISASPLPDAGCALAARGRLIGVDDGVAGAEGRTLRRRMEELAERPRPASGSDLTSPMLPVIAPPVGLLVDERPFEEHRRTQEQRPSG